MYTQCSTAHRCDPGYLSTNSKAQRRGCPGQPASREVCETKLWKGGVGERCRVLRGGWERGVEGMGGG